MARSARPAKRQVGGTSIWVVCATRTTFKIVGAHETRLFSSISSRIASRLKLHLRFRKRARTLKCHTRTCSTNCCAEAADWTRLTFLCPQNAAKRANRTCLPCAQHVMTSEQKSSARASAEQRDVCIFPFPKTHRTRVGGNARVIRGRARCARDAICKARADVGCRQM